MGFAFGNEKFRLTFVLSLIFMLLVSFSFSPFVNAAEVSSKEKAEELALAIYKSSNYQEDTRTFDFDEAKAVSLGLDKYTARQMSIYFKGLSGDEAEAVYKAQEEATSSNQLAAPPLLIWAAGVLAAAGFTWLAEKLLDYGAKKFCNAYRYSNSVTEFVCDVIAP